MESVRQSFRHCAPGQVSLVDNNITKRIRPYIPSSPRFGRADPRSLTEGDAHYWGVWHDAEPFEILEEKIPRFMSEFGFQSLPRWRRSRCSPGPVSGVSTPRRC